MLEDVLFSAWIYYHFSLEHVLPFGVRILNAFLTLSEYLNLYDALSESAYRQSVRSDSTGAFPDMYTRPHSPETSRNPSEDLGGDKLQQHSSGDVASSHESSVGESTEKKGDSDKNCPENEVSAVPSDAPGGHMLQAEKGGVDSEIVTITRGTEPLSSIKCKDESSEEATWKTQGDSVSNISVEHSHEFGDRSRNVVITGVEEIESGSRALKAETGEESNECVVGNKASDTKDERNEVEARTHLRFEVKQNETEAGSGVVTNRTKVDKRKNEVLDFLTRKRIGGKKDKENAKAVIARENEKPEKDVGTASPQEKVGGEGGPNDTTSVRTKESSIGAFSKPEHRAMEKGDALSTAFDIRSCESLYDIGVRSMAFDSSCESNLSSVSLTMETVDVLRIKVVECSGARFDKQERCEREQDRNKSVLPCSTTDDSKCSIVGPSENEETCSPVLNGLIPKVFQIFEDGNVGGKSLKSSSGSEKCCQACADVKKSSTCISTDSNVCGSHEDVGEVRSKETCTNKDPSSVETDSESGSEDLLPDDQETDFSETNQRDGERANCGTDTDTDTPSSVEVKENSCKGLASRNELIKTPIVCDSFAVRNLNSRSPEKFLEKSFVATADDLKTERSDTPNAGANVKLVENDSYEETSESRKTLENVSENPVSSVVVDDRMSVPRSEIEGTAKNASEIFHSNGASNAEVDGGNPPTESLNYIEYDSEIHVTNGHEGPAAVGVVGMPVDSAQEEIEGSSHDQWQEPQFPVQPEDDEGEALWFEEDGDDINQVTNSVTIPYSIHFRLGT